MAETAGLALGGLALASLFKTCVELVEYFELGKSYVYDRRLAASKVNLLRTRLQNWGASQGISHPGDDKELLRLDWLEQGDLIADSLLSIKAILGNTTELTRKYGLETKRKSLLKYLSWRPPVPSPMQENPERGVADHPGRGNPRKNVSLRRQTTWAIQDKRKFDALIADLDFFITNLEKVGSRLVPESTNHSTQENKCHAPTSSAMAIGTIGASPNGNPPNHLRAVTGTQTQTQTQTRKPTQDGSLVVQQARSTSSSDPTQGGFHHVYRENKQTGNSTWWKGDIEASPNAKKHVYEKNETSGNAMVFAGNMSKAAFAISIKARSTPT